MRIAFGAAFIIMLGAGLLGTGAARAQDYSQAATYGDYTISGAGQTHEIEVVAGGETDAAGLGGACVGQIATAPDIQLSLDSGGAPLTITVASDFDSTLVINTATGDWVCDDDSAGGLNARVEIANPTTGVYDIWVGAFSEDENYSTSMVTISQGAAATNAPVLASAPTGVDRLERGTLEAGDATRDGGAYQDAYAFDGSAGESAVFDLRSEDFDTYLQVFSPSGQEFSNDDYDGDLNRSLLSLDLSENGQYRIVASSFFEDETGAYALSISRPMAIANVPRIEETGSLAATDEVRPNSGYVDTFTFEGAPGRRATIDLTSEDFDTYLVLTSPSGAVRENDDLDSLYHSQIIADLQDSGTYRVQVTSYAEGETGDYRLTISQTAAPSATPGQGSRDTVELALGQSLNGLLENSDGQFEPSRYQDLYSFNGEAGQSVHVEMSGGFDTYIIVRAPGGEEYINDDYEGSLTRSAVDITLPVSGRYQVIATSYGAETFGNYQIAATQMASTPVNPVTTVADDGVSTIYGIFAGISDYSQLRQSQPGWGDLSYTAQDALVARDALMASAGMQEQNAFTFTDRQATRANIEAAFREIAGRIDSDDVFVFFYSGHGGQTRRPGGFNAADADGYDETLALSDQTITDDEVNELFNMINAAASVIILDSCYSGGFAKDVVSAPGRMGLFSSDEDVPSLVAGKFQAGGYLSYFFSDAVNGGNADEDGDSSINAMELSQYIHIRYSEEAMTKGPSRFDTPHFGYQHLVVDRGGVAHDAVLFNVN